MTRDHERGIPSRAALGTHPIHPMLIPFPIAFLIGALATDIVYWTTFDPFWAHASLWLILGGLVTGVIAAAVGQIDFWTIPRARAHSAGWIHFLGNVGVLLLAFVNLLWRWADPIAGVIPWGIGMSAVTTVLLGVAGWYGGELVYRHKIGVVGNAEETVPDQPTTGPHRIFPERHAPQHRPPGKD